MQWQNRAHFFAIAAHTMRQVLVEYARRACSSRCGHMPAKYWASWASVSMPNVITHQDGRCKCYCFTIP